MTDRPIDKPGAARAFDTRCVRAGVAPDPTTGAIVPPLYQTATYVLPEVGRDLGFDYTRSANPTRLVMETALADLEGGRRCVAFASGMSAVDAVLRRLSAGDHVVSSDDVYGGVSRLMNRILTRFGLTFTYVDSSNPGNVREALRPNTKMIWLETPTNPLLKVTDLEAVARIGKEAGVPVAVDSTFATPALLRPLEWGVDLVVHSTTKYLSGHNVVIGGAVVTDDEGWYDALRFVQKSVGAVPSPFDSWLTVLGMKTLHLRMARHSESALHVAKWLEAHRAVARVCYPGLPSHPGHGVASRQMAAFSGMISFELHGGLEAGRRLMNRVRLCSLAESLGSVETMITHPATMTHVDVPAADRHARGLTDGLVRLSVGIEDPGDIVADLAQALA